jgi:PAS domain S-box-containing protein
VLRQIIDLVPHFIFAKDEDSRFLLVNRAVAEAYGSTPEALVGKSDSDFSATPEEATHFREDDLAILRDGRPRVISEEPITDARGNVRFLQTTKIPFHLGTDGRPALLGISIDVTERKRSEEALRASERRYRVLAETTQDIIATRDAEGRITYVNPAGVALAGGDPSRLLSLRIPDLLAPEMREASRDRAVRRRAGDRGVFRYETEIVVPGGGRVPLEVHSTVFRDERGEEQILMVARDIRERRRVEAAERESDLRLRRMLDDLHLAAVVHDQEGRVLFCNEYLAGLVGVPRDEMAGRDWPSFLRPAAGPEDEWEAYRRALAAGGVVPHAEFSIRAHDGRTRVLVWDSTPLRDAEGRTTAIASLGRDVTDYRLLEEQYRQAQRMEAIGRLAGGIAHDFNNALTSITGNVSLALLDLDADHPVRSALEDVGRAADHAATLTRQLLAFSRKQILEPRVVSPNELIGGAARLLRRLIGEDVVLRLILAPEVGNVRADPGQIEQILVNLAVNARDAMPDGGRLTLETWPVDLDDDYCRSHGGASVGPYVMIAVSDTGQGMTAAVKEHLFEPFFTTKPQGRGTGLGLSMVYGAVRQHGGLIEVYSEPGAGTTFKIYLPRCDAPRAAMDGAAEATPRCGSWPTACCGVSAIGCWRVRIRARRWRRPRRMPSRSTFCSRTW